MKSEEVILKPPAKINLFLDVGPLRSDGFHDISSIFQTLDLYDRLTIRPASQDCFSLRTFPNQGAPENPDNTVWKAYLAFQNIFPEVPLMEVDLEKQIPVQAGLGGGSSDAGVFLQYLWKTYSPGLSEPEMINIASKVGSDVPFFLWGGTCQIEGRGEKVTPLPSLPSFPLLLLHPRVDISTAAAYRALDEIPDRIHPSMESIKRSVERSDWDGVLSHLFNSFEQWIYQEHPFLSDLNTFCKDQGFEAVLLSGSGSNLFVLHPDREKLQHLQNLLNQSFPDVPSTLTCTLA